MRLLVERLVVERLAGGVLDHPDLERRLAVAAPHDREPQQRGLGDDAADQAGDLLDDGRAHLVLDRADLGPAVGLHACELVVAEGAGVDRRRRRRGQLLAEFGALERVQRAVLAVVDEDAAAVLGEVADGGARGVQRRVHLVVLVIRAALYERGDEAVLGVDVD